MQEATDRRSSSFSRAEDETLPEGTAPRHETRQVGRGQVIEHLLADIRAKLTPLPQGKARRALMSKLESFQLAFDSWDAIPPRPEQVSAMIEVLLVLQEAADCAA